MKEQVGPNDFVARYGGEEFALILLDRSDAEADQIGECIRLNVRAMHHEEIDGSVSISGGLARYEPGRGKEWLFVTADEMLYRAKHEGKDKIVAHHAISAR
ncbi:hypothetical protein GCM10025857_30730 [Alicyclobacillus contaminans]|uniref:GGDEF domain-containing protein n=1 Tax=Alicyclobacillus contaminans TaxID=392016 RepID=UPI0004787504|nr:GGDEF domain-containing protein [Alicyclobacillus contaminans]GMA51716.1 hypothetical protein GCM10025857_30730 [Alicyclobacillus contaminans]